MTTMKRLLFCGAVIATFLLLLGCGNSSSPNNNIENGEIIDSTSMKESKSKEIESEIEAKINYELSEYAQSIFTSIHPTGTVNSFKLNSVNCNWRNGYKTANKDDIVSVEWRFTLYWEGPITKDGYTQISHKYDCEVERIVEQNIIQTNGITNNGILELGASALGSALDSIFQ